MAYIWTMYPKYSEELVYGLHLVPSASTSWLHFSPNEMLAVNRVPIKSSGTIQCLERLALSSFPARAIPGSCTHARWLRSKLSLQRALSNLSQHWMMWECSLQSPRCFQSAGFLLSFSPAFGTVWILSAPLNHCKHFMNVNEKIGLIEKTLLTFPMIIWIFSPRQTHQLNNFTFPEIYEWNLKTNKQLICIYLLYIFVYLNYFF